MFYGCLTLNMLEIKYFPFFKTKHPHSIPVPVFFLCLLYQLTAPTVIQFSKPEIKYIYFHFLTLSPNPFMTTFIVDANIISYLYYCNNF